MGDISTGTTVRSAARIAPGLATMRRGSMRVFGGGNTERVLERGRHKGHYRS